MLRYGFSRVSLRGLGGGIQNCEIPIPYLRLTAPCSAKLSRCACSPGLCGQVRGEHPPLQSRGPGQRFIVMMKRRVRDEEMKTDIWRLSTILAGYALMDCRCLLLLGAAPVGEVHGQKRQVLHRDRFDGLLGDPCVWQPVP